MRCARDECDNTEVTTKSATLRTRSRVHDVLRVDALDLGFTLSLVSDASTSSKMVSFVKFNFTTQTQHQVQSSFLQDVVVRLCPVIVHSICIPNSCLFLIAKTGLLRLQEMIRCIVALLSALNHSVTRRSCICVKPTNSLTPNLRNSEHK